MAKENIKIPAKHYVGMVRRGEGKLPLAFITPSGEDAASLKRIATVDSWVSSNGRYGGNKPLPSMTIDNVPLSGFKLTSDIRSSSYGGLDKWRVEDPRGFELEITSGNLARLLSVGMIDRGEINDQCVWGRDGSNNILISVNTDEYKAAVENTKVAGLTAEWKNAKPGNTVLLQNNIRGIWLGRMHPLFNNRDREQAAIGNNELVPSDKSLHVILVNEPVKHSECTRQLMLVSSPKLAAIEDTTSITEAEAEKQTNDLLGDRRCYVVTNTYKSVIALTFGSVQPGKTSLHTVNIDVTEDEIRSAVSDYNRRRRHIYVVDSNGDFGLISRRYDRSNANALGIMVFCQNSLTKGELRAVNTSATKSGYWGNSGVSWSQKVVDHKWDANTQYLNLMLTLSTKSGNQLQILL